MEGRSVKVWVYKRYMDDVNIVVDIQMEETSDNKEREVELRRRKTRTGS